MQCKLFPTEFFSKSCSYSYLITMVWKLEWNSIHFRDLPFPILQWTSSNLVTDNFQAVNIQKLQTHEWLTDDRIGRGENANAHDPYRTLLYSPGTYSSMVVSVGVQLFHILRRKIFIKDIRFIFNFFKEYKLYIVIHVDI